jgi:hypothetical protein
LSEQRLQTLVMRDPPTLAALRQARALALPDWYLAAGWIRALVWDHLTARRSDRAGVDLDLIFHDPADLSWQRDHALDARLGPPWQARNQARMHLDKGDPPYRDCLDSMRYWLETPTAVGVRLEADDRLTIAAPFGLDDLFSLTLRPTPRGRERLADFQARLENKAWRRTWPELRIVDSEL